MPRSSILFADLTAILATLELSGSGRCNGEWRGALTQNGDKQHDDWASIGRRFIWVAWNVWCFHNSWLTRRCYRIKWFRTKGTETERNISLLTKSVGTWLASSTQRSPLASVHNSTVKIAWTSRMSFLANQNSSANLVLDGKWRTITWHLPDVPSYLGDQRSASLDRPVLAAAPTLSCNVFHRRRSIAVIDISLKMKERWSEVKTTGKFFSLYLSDKVVRGGKQFVLKQANIGYWSPIFGCMCKRFRH